jgi:hypothetical protein
MRVRNEVTKEYKTVDLSDTILMELKEVNYKGSKILMRVWKDFWFPLNPVDGYDLRGYTRPKRERKTKILKVIYKG